jgi:cell division protein FtsX
MMMAAMAAPAFAQGSAARTLRVIPQANLTSLDPVWTTAVVTRNHGMMVYDNITTVNLAALRAALSAIDTNIRVEDRGPWVGHMVKAVALLQGLVLLVAILLLLCVLGMIILVSRTNLRLHFKTVSLLHMFGATDDYILRQFQWNNAWLAARGAFTGVAIAAAVFISAVIIAARWDSPVIPHISISIMHVVMFIILPIFTAMIALVATRLTVQSMLENMH